MTVTTTTRDALTSFGLLILRLGGGTLLATHGWGKVKDVFDGEPNQFPDPLGIGTDLSLMGAAFSEFFCSILVIMGLVTRLAAIPPAITMAVAAFIIHQNDPWTGPPPSKEGALVFLTIFLALIFTGAGKYSLDGLLFRRKVAVKAVKT